MRFLIRLSGDGSEGAFLSSVRSIARSLGAEARNAKWTSKGSLEIDIFVPSRQDFELFLEALRPIARLEFSRDLNLAPQFRPEPELFEEAWSYFNSERYWECHEVLEGIWRTKSGEEKSLLQGIILVCAAFVHHQKREPAVALSVMRRAMLQLHYHSRMYNSIDVSNLNQRAADIVKSGNWANFQV